MICLSLARVCVKCEGVSARFLTKSEYARRLWVQPAAVSNWVTRGKLSPPAIRPDGRINPVLADRQLGTRRGAGRPDATDNTAAAIGAFIAPGELPALAQALRLDRGQVSQAAGRWGQFLAGNPSAHTRRTEVQSRSIF